MSDLSGIEKIKLEKILEMGNGYVLDFTNRTFQDFIQDCCHIDIYNAKYDYASGSKANRLRRFWNKESNHIAGKLLSNLLDYWLTLKEIGFQEITKGEQSLFSDCKQIAKRLEQDNSVENIEAIQSYSNEKEFSLLVKSIRDSIEKNEPESALDRLHTFTVKYIRKLCDKHSIIYDKDMPLHSLFGNYIKYLTQNNLTKSLMTERILKSSISILDSFNMVRNNQSFAHDNTILNYNESMLIFNNIANFIKFIESIETDDGQITKTEGNLLDLEEPTF